MGPSCAQGVLSHQKCRPGPGICLLRIFFKDKEKVLWRLNSKAFHAVGVRLEKVWLALSGLGSFKILALKEPTFTSIWLVQALWRSCQSLSLCFLPPPKCAFLGPTLRESCFQFGNISRALATVLGWALRGTTSIPYLICNEILLAKHHYIYSSSLTSKQGG